MHRAHRATRAVLLALGLVLAGSGCGNAPPENVKVLRLQIPSFDEAALQGIWMWRRSEISGEFEPLSEIRFHEVVTEEGGREFLEYSLFDPEGGVVPVELSAEVLRTGENVELSLWFVRFSEPGDFRATLYNEAGESALSAETIVL